MKYVERVLTVVAVLILAWLFISFLDVVFHNLGSCEYHVWNAFELFCNYLETL